MFALLYVIGFIGLSAFILGKIFSKPKKQKGKNEMDSAE